MTARGKVVNGYLYTTVSTAPAAVALPYRYRQDDHVEVALFRQKQPEIEKTVLKTVGGLRWERS